MRQSAGRCSEPCSRRPHAALIVDDLAAMLTFADELVALAAGFDERTYVRALVDGALALRFQGRNVDAEARLRQAWDGARRAVLPQATVEVGAMFGNVLLSMGQVDEAEVVVRECAALGTRLVEFGPSRAFTVILPHLVELARGDWRRAVDGLRASAAAEPDPHYRQHAHRERAAALARLDPHHGAEEVREALAAALADAETAGCERCLTESTARAAEALARIGDPDGARSLLARTHVPPPTPTTASACNEPKQRSPRRAVTKSRRSRPPRQSSRRPSVRACTSMRSGHGSTSARS